MDGQEQETAKALDVEDQKPSTEADGGGTAGQMDYDPKSEPCHCLGESMQLRHNYEKNRILPLLKYDIIAFGASAALLGGVLLALANQSEEASWRAEVSFFLCRLVYALSALPFLLFHVPGMRTLLSHTFATGFNEAGECVPYDCAGLSAFVKWFEHTLTQPSMRELLSPEELLRLEQLLADAKRTLAGRDGRGAGVAKAVLDRRLSDIEARLAAAVLPNHPLFPVCFPERLICIEYEKMMSEARTARRRAALATRPAKQTFTTWDEHQSARYGVNWQKDSEATDCSLCGQSFSFFRRRHHCRTCGRLCCNACSRARRIPAKGSEAPKRCCDQCVLSEGKEAGGEGFDGQDHDELLARTTQEEVSETTASEGEVIRKHGHDQIDHGTHD